ncbi:MAG: hypothetical protein NUV78_01895 [Candidatus Zambryskibacteria bacterium]|nr:hypothetical protein [Candidatus Zambryskibacteria bacterium]
MKIEFAYDPEKDVENFIKTLKSTTDQSLTNFHKQYIEEQGENFDPDNVKSFILGHLSGVNVLEVVSKIEDEWRPIEQGFIERCEKIFGIKYPLEKISAYLTTNNRCSYNTKGNYFFVYLHNKKSNNPSIMHEIFHFYTYYTFYEELMWKSVSREKYEDIKESLTELLNLEFSDLMNGATDWGYPQHQEKRAKVRSIWISGKNINKVVNELIN